MKIEISTTKVPDSDRVLQLFQKAGWLDKADADRIKLMIQNSTIVVTAWDKGKMVGFARCLTDFVFNGQINNVVVDEKYKGRGIGKALIEQILCSSKKVTYILRPGSRNKGFYDKLGFEHSDSSIFKRME